MQANQIYLMNSRIIIVHETSSYVGTTYKWFQPCEDLTSLTETKGAMKISEAQLNQN